ncbi:hypothetical protein [Xanthomonas citri]
MGDVRGYSMAKSVNLDDVLSALRGGAELILVASARGGYVWHLMPGAIDVDSSVAEAAVALDFVACTDGYVGRVNWVYRDTRYSGNTQVGDFVPEMPALPQPGASSEERALIRAKRKEVRTVLRGLVRKMGPVALPSVG